MTQYGNERTTAATSHEHACFSHCVSWGGVIAGSIVAVGLMFLLNVFCLAIGLSVFKTSTTGGAATVAIGGFIALLIGLIASLFVAGWVSGYLGRKHSQNRNIGALHGFLAWCVALIIMVSIASSLNEFVKTTYATLSNPNVAFQTTANEKAPVVSERPRLFPHESQSMLTVNPEKATTVLGTTLFVTFFLFLIGAIASCFGGYFGSKQEEDPFRKRS